MRRIMLGAGTLVLAAVIGLAACGSDDEGATATDPTGSVADSVPDDTANGVQSTPFATVAPTSTTSPPTSTLPPQPGDVIETESRYTIVSGDFPSTVASKFKVDMQAMLDLNGFELEGNMVPEWPQPGTEIMIPAGATVPNPDGSSATTAPPSGGGDATGSTTAGAPTTVDICAASTYEIQAGDAKFTVANKFDTTVEALDAANVNTPNYDSFIVGFDIVIPAKTDC